MASLNPDHVQAVIKVINRGPYFKHLAMPVREMGIGYSIVELKMGNEHLNPFGGIHGGVYASVIDTARFYNRKMTPFYNPILTHLDLKKYP